MRFHAPTEIRTRVTASLLKKPEVFLQWQGRILTTKPSAHYEKVFVGDFSEAECRLFCLSFSQKLTTKPSAHLKKFF
jgi:hypothetical protein